MHASDSEAQVPSPTIAPRRRPIPLGRKLFFLALLLLAALAAMEFLARVYWTIRGLPFLDCQRRIQYVYYDNVPAFRFFMRDRRVVDRNVQLLLLGGSTIHPSLGPIPSLLLERLTRRLDRRIEVNNLAMPAHTSLDSYYKYRDLADKSFDLVLVYNAANELRANNCPSWMFHDDYAHYLWYHQVNAVERGSAGRLLAFPIMLHLWSIDLAKRVGLLHFIPDDAPVNPAWNRFGGEIKTAEPFRRNLERIIELGHERGEKVVLMTFANYLAPGYTREKFERRRLDYLAHWFAVEVWGTPENVAKGLAAHNEKIRELARRHADDVLFVDQDALIPKQGRYFNDICHLSNEGCALFVDNLMPVIAPYLERLLASRPPADASR